MKPTFSVDLYKLETRKHEPSIAHGGRMENFDVGGRPLFKNERFRFQNPAPINYKPDNFSRYEKSTLSFSKKNSIPNELRFVKRGETHEPSPLSYAPEKTKDIMMKKHVAHSIPRM